MGKGKDEEREPFKATDIDAAKRNIETAVNDFADRWLPMPRFTEECEVMSQAQLRDAMGLRATWDIGDPWPNAEKMLMERGFRWHNLGGMRVMFLRERDGYKPDDGWEEAEEVE